MTSRRIGTREEWITARAKVFRYEDMWSDQQEVFKQILTFCGFDLPAYHAWQRLDAGRRRADLLQWADSLMPLGDALQVLLGLLRDSGVPQMVAASGGPVRFTELERSIDGISRRMLTLTLRNLERDGLLARTVYPTVPPKVEYTATPMARELYDSLTALTSWADRHRADIAAAREEYDRAHGN